MTQQRSNEVDIDFLVERLSLQDFRAIRGQLYAALAELRTYRARGERAEARVRAVEAELATRGITLSGLSLQEEQE